MNMIYGIRKHCVPGVLPAVGEEIVPAVSGNFSRPRSASTSAIGGETVSRNSCGLTDAC